tara:strand:- start:227 stop:439 length:213 start_codon:yes stop_codon:yes gene_type:complete
MPILKKKRQGEKVSFSTSAGVVRALVDGDYLIVESDNPKEVQQLINIHGFNLVQRRKTLKSMTKGIPSKR